MVMSVQREIQIQTYHSPVGPLIIGSFNDQLCLCDWQHRQSRATIDKRIQTSLRAHYKEKNAPVIKQTIEQLNQYFQNHLQQFDLPLLLLGTDFQHQVWLALQQIPYGKTLSYQALAGNINHQKAVRAVANANAANAISLVIPCHRVISSKGQLTGYAGGVETKRQLLALEKTNIQ